jgi:hypothetical protein
MVTMLVRHDDAVKIARLAADALQRVTVSRNPKPQSSISVVAPDSTSSALPALPLPARQNGSLQLLKEQAENLLRSFRLVGAAFGRQHLDDALLPVLAHVDAVLGIAIDRRIALPESQLGHQAGILLAAVVGVGVNVAYEVQATRAITIFDGKADAVQRQAYTAPRTVEALEDFQRSSTVVRLGQLGAWLSLDGSQRGFGTLSSEPRRTIRRRSISASSSGSAARGCQRVSSLAEEV